MKGLNILGNWGSVGPLTDSRYYQYLAEAQRIQDLIQKIEAVEDQAGTTLSTTELQNRKRALLSRLDEGFLDAVGSHGPHDLADIAVKVMFNHLILGKSVPQRVISPMILITRDNIDTPEGMIFGFPAAWPSGPPHLRRRDPGQHPQPQGPARRPPQQPRQQRT